MRWEVVDVPELPFSVPIRVVKTGFRFRITARLYARFLVLRHQHICASYPACSLLWYYTVRRA